jgi:hypothetical protein
MPIFIVAPWARALRNRAGAATPAANAAENSRLVSLIPILPVPNFMRLIEIN